MRKILKISKCEREQAELVGDCRRVVRPSKFEINCYHMSNQNLRNLNTNKFRPCRFSKPITYSNLPHRQHARNTVPRNVDKLFQTQKGIIFIWPQTRRYYYERELCLLTKLIAHILYWLHIGNLLPGCAGIVLKQPPWQYKPPPSKPEDKDFIIEPDWRSQYL